MKQKQARLSRLGTGLFSFLCIVYVLPIVVVLMNSFKKKSYISLEPFQLPDGNTFTGLEIRVMLIGMVVAFVVSLLAIGFLMRYVKKHSFRLFGWYRIALGVLVLGVFFVQGLLA